MPSASEDYTEYLDQLFRSADRFLGHNPYSSIDSASSFHTKVVGVSFEGRQEIIAELAVDTPIHLERDPFNLNDSNAIKIVTNDGRHFGFLNRQISSILAPVMDSGTAYFASIASLTGGDNGKARGVNLFIVKNESSRDDFDPMFRNNLQKLDDHELFAYIRKAILGDNEYHVKQKEAIKSLLDGKSILSIFGTSRGKSGIFQTVAVYKAIREETITVIVYPLRALANDQYFSMQTMFSRLGLRVYRANGGLSSSEKADVFRAIETEDIDILLTTPEWLLYHAEKLNPILDRIRFFVTDEAHHLMDKHRSGYRRLNQVIKILGNPQVCAVTATADDSTARTIAKTLNISVLVVDDYERTNLEIWDVRDTKDKEAYLLEAVKNSKSIVYVGTRKDTVRLAKLIRENLPGYENLTGFYHAGMSTTDRCEVERLFRDNKIQVVVCTTAFGEGINIPDISEVVIYQMLFNFTQFNQQSGRGGRNGKPARIHLLFGEKDSSLNLHIVKSKAPTREQIAAVYQVLRVSKGDITNGEITDSLRRQKYKGINDTLVSTCIGILGDLGVIEREVYGNHRTITVIAHPPKKDLLTSLRYQEGQEELDDYFKFHRELLGMTGRQLEKLIRKPICPQHDILAETKEMEPFFLDDLLPQCG
jgi:Superfamily II DNA helicase